MLNRNILKYPAILKILIPLFVGMILSGRISGQTVRVLSYNIHHANPPGLKDSIDLEAIAKVITDADVDIVGLQEIDINVSRSNFVNQATKLAELTGMNYYFSKGINLEKGYYGTLILTKHKITGKRRYDLPMPVQSENRSVAIVDIELPDGKKVSFANTHLDLHEENRIKQVEFISDLADLYERPLILVGDLNAQPESKPMKLIEKVFTRNTQAKVLTIPADNPTSEIDYIMVGKHSEFEWKQYRTIPEKAASDHLPLFAEIKFL